MNETNLGVMKRRSGDLQRLDEAIRQFGASRTPENLSKVRNALENWKRSKDPAWVSSRNGGGAIARLEEQLANSAKASVKCNGVAVVPPLYIPKGRTAKFTLEGLTPAELPSWTANVGVHKSGTGNNFLNTFQAVENGIVAVTCDRLAMPITVQVQVFEVEGVLTPEDNFAGRAKDKFGVDEHIVLGIKTTPPGIAAAALGGLRWEVKGSQGKRSECGLLQKDKSNSAVPDDTGSAYYIAPFITGEADDLCFNLRASKDITLQAVITSGLFKGHAFEKTVKVFAPRAHMVVSAGSDLHENNFPSAGFIGLAHMHPTNVSFRTLEWSESIGTVCAAGLRSGKGKGYFQNAHNTQHHSTRWTAGKQGAAINAYARSGMQVKGGNCQTGCWVQQQDQVWTGYDDQWKPTRAIAAQAASAAPLRVQQPKVFSKFGITRPAFIASHSDLGGGGKNEIVEPSTMDWPIDWQYKVATAPLPDPNRWIVFQIVIHHAEVDGQGTTTVSKGSTDQPWALAKVTKNLGDPTTSATTSVFPGSLACKD